MSTYWVMPAIIAVVVAYFAGLHWLTRGDKKPAPPERAGDWEWTKETRWQEYQRAGEFVKERMEVLTVNMDDGAQEWVAVGDYAHDLWSLRALALHGFGPPYTRIRRAA
jgi:hypothetical protein